MGARRRACGCRKPGFGMLQVAPREAAHVFVARSPGCESAGKRQPGRISRQGPPMLRWAAYEAGLAACRASSPDHADYLALRDRPGHKTASISRRVLRRAYHALVASGDAALEPIPD